MEALAVLRPLPPLVRAYQEDSSEPQQRRLCGMSHTRLMDTPIGTLLIESDEDAITYIELPRADRPLKARTSVDAVDEPRVLSEAVSQLTEYFAGTRTQFSLPLS